MMDLIKVEKLAVKKGWTITYKSESLLYVGPTFDDHHYCFSRRNEGVRRIFVSGYDVTEHLSESDHLMLIIARNCWDDES